MRSIDEPTLCEGLPDQVPGNGLQSSRVTCLIDRAKNGDSEAVSRLYRLCSGRLRMVARRRLGRQLRLKLESMDVVQSVWKDVLVDLGRFTNGGFEEFLLWLDTRILRKIKDRGRYYTAQKRDMNREEDIFMRCSDSLDSPLPRTQDTSPSTAAARDEGTQRFLEFVRSLPGPERQAVILRMCDDMSYTEIGRHMGVPTEEAKRLCTKGVRSLAHLIVLWRHNRPK